MFLLTEKMSNAAADFVYLVSDSAAEAKASVQALNEIFSKLTVAATPEERAPFATSFATLLSSPVEDHDVPTTVTDKLKSALSSKKDPVARQAALEAIAAVAQKQFTPSIEPFIVSLTPSILEKASDKVPAVKALAEPVTIAVVKAINPNSVKYILPLISEVVSSTPKWQEKVAALNAIVALVDAAPGQVALRMPELIPLLSEAMWDTKADVKKAARAAMEKATETIQNKDIEKFIPQLIECIAKPTNVPETVHALGATTFVQEVTSGTLSIMVPLLSRGLAERDTTIKRKAAVIIDNMCKLVEDPQVVAPFLPKLMPGLKANYDNIADPEARDVTLRGLNTLTRVGDVKDGKIPEVSTAGDVKVCLGTLEKFLKDKKVDKKFTPIFEYVAAIAGTFVDERNNEAVTWTETITPYLTAFLHEDEAKTIVESFRKESIANIPGSAVEEEEEEEGEDLCNCEFSLAYGAKILLNRTALRLKRGRRYGLCGPNGSGKSTLMRAIANGQVEGFPTQEECKTVYVEHDIDGSHAETSVLEFVATDPLVVDSSEESVKQALLDVGFTSEMIQMPITSLSGGWKMKLALARAVLKKADILLLDEPTNHLDTVNVAWLENYLNTCGITSIIVSHDSAFLDHVVEFIIHYERFKLKKYKGNLSEFVKKVPTAKSYYELGASEMEFQFPEPGFLEGVKTKQKAIVKVSNMTFQYPGTSKPQIRDITFQCSLSSRIAVIGPNGAGKSTLINVLTGELLPTQGEVYVHENCRIAYIKQHAFAHIDQHLDKTPSEYIQWRFQTGEDRETMDRANRIINEDDEQAMNHIYKIDGTPRRVVAVNGRRKFKNTYEYECSFVLGENIGQKNERWIPMLTADNSWIPRNELIQTHAKMVAEVDMKEALASGQFRPLTRKEIEAHCAMLGLEAELVSHSRIRGLSGGQKVKLVLAACTWQRPHLIVLDEPTNYLDRDSLGALSKALKGFAGGIVIITHSAEFTKDLTEEVWAVLDGRMTPSGHNWVQGQGAGPRLDSKEGEEEEKFDAMGNKIETVKKAKKLSAAELRKKKKERMLKKKKLGDAYVSSDEDF